MLRVTIAKHGDNPPSAADVTLVRIDDAQPDPTNGNKVAPASSETLELKGSTWSATSTSFSEPPYDVNKNYDNWGYYTSDDDPVHTQATFDERLGFAKEIVHSAELDIPSLPKQL